MNNAVVITDASCLIALDNIGEIDLLQRLFDQIYITPDVSKEYDKPLPEWIIVRKPVLVDRQREFQGSLDPGEAGSIALALEWSEALLIIDEKKGRRLAISLGIEIIGTVGVLLEAHSRGHIELSPSLIESLEAANFRLSSVLKSKLLYPKSRVQ